MCHNEQACSYGIQRYLRGISQIDAIRKINYNIFMTRVMVPARISYAKSVAGG
jgi:hypothetical protein